MSNSCVTTSATACFLSYCMNVRYGATERQCILHYGPCRSCDSLSPFSKAPILAFRSLKLPLCSGPASLWQTRSMVSCRIYRNPVSDRRPSLSDDLLVAMAMATRCFAFGTALGSFSTLCFLYGAVPGVKTVSSPVFVMSLVGQ